MTTLRITLREEDREFIEEGMKSGRYVSESEAVADAFAELRARESLRKARMAELKKQVQIGLDQLDRGEKAVWDPEEIIAKGRSLLAARQAQPE